MQHEQPLLTNRTNVKRWPWLRLLLWVLGAPRATLGQEPPDTNYDESKVPKYELPDPLVCLDGRPVSEAAMWRETRRPEIRQAFAQHVYGRTPEIKTHLRFEPIGADAEVFDGLATRKQIRIRLLEADDAPWIDLLLYVPHHTSGPAPVFLGLNYGNQGIHPDPEIIPSRNAVCQRGEHAQRWPLELLLKRGYAVASFHGGDIELDRHGSGCRFTDEGWQKGIRHFVMQHFMESDFLRAGENPSREMFPELPRTPYFIFVARKTGLGRHEEGYPLRLQDPLLTVGLPLGPSRPDLPLDLAAAFQAAYDLSARPGWIRYREEPVPAPALAPDDAAWVRQIVQSAPG